MDGKLPAAAVEFSTFMEGNYIGHHSESGRCSPLHFILERKIFVWLHWFQLGWWSQEQTRTGGPNLTASYKTSPTPIMQWRAGTSEHVFMNYDCVFVYVLIFEWKYLVLCSGAQSELGMNGGLWKFLTWLRVILLHILLYAHGWTIALFPLIRRRRPARRLHGGRIWPRSIR